MCEGEKEVGKAKGHSNTSVFVRVRVCVCAATGSIPGEPSSSTDKSGVFSLSLTCQKTCVNLLYWTFGGTRRPTVQRKGKGKG